MILYCADKLDISGMGGGIAAYHELLALCATGHQVVVLTSGRTSLPGKVDDHTISEPEWIVPHEIKVSFPPELSRRYLISQWELISITRKIRSLKPDLIVVQGPSSHRRIESYRSWGTIPRTMTLHGSPDAFTGVYQNGKNQLKRVAAELVAYTAAVHASELVQRKWDLVAPTLKKPKSYIVHNTIDENIAQSVREKTKKELREFLGISPDYFALVCTASIQMRKGQDLLIQQMERLMASIPNIQLYLVGPVVGHWGGREILRMINTHPARDHIHVLQKPRGSDALAYTRAADVYVLPTREEAMPLSILEAMYLDTPVVASDVDGIPDEVEDGVSGLLFSHDRPAGLHEAVIRMAQDSDFRTSCAVRGRLRYEQKFTRRQFFERWEAVVNELMNSGVRQ